MQNNFPAEQPFYKRDGMHLMDEVDPYRYMPGGSGSVFKRDLEGFDWGEMYKRSGDKAAAEAGTIETKTADSGRDNFTQQDLEFLLNPEKYTKRTPGSYSYGNEENYADYDYDPFRAQNEGFDNMAHKRSVMRNYVKARAMVRRSFGNARGHGKPFMSKTPGSMTVSGFW